MRGTAIGKADDVLRRLDDLSYTCVCYCVRCASRMGALDEGPRRPSLHPLPRTRGQGAGAKEHALLKLALVKVQRLSCQARSQEGHAAIPDGQV